MSPSVACTESADDTCEMIQMIINPQMGNICNPSGHKDGNPPPVFHTNISSAKALPALRCAKSRHLRELLIGSCHFPPTSESCTRFIGYNVNVSSWCIPEQRWRGIEGKAFNRCMLTPSIQFSVCSLFNESFVLDIVLFVCGVLWVRTCQVESAPTQTVSVESGQPSRLGYRSKQSFGWCDTPTEILSLGSLQTSTSMTKSLSCTSVCLCTAPLQWGSPCSVESSATNLLLHQLLQVHGTNLDLSMQETGAYQDHGGLLRLTLHAAIHHTSLILIPHSAGLS